MVPLKREDNYIVLRCPRCGYTERVPVTEAKDYTLVDRSPEEERVITTLRVGTSKKKPVKSKEEWEQEREEYREILQDLLQQELEGGEE